MAAIFGGIIGVTENESGPPNAKRPAIDENSDLFDAMKAETKDID